MIVRRLLIGLAVLTMVVAPVLAQDQKTLYDRLGGETALRAILDDFYDQCQQDGEMRTYFIGMDMPRLKRELLRFVGRATGGPEKYYGRDMKSAHERMHITQSQWTRAMGFLRNSLDKFKVPAQEQKDLSDVVQEVHDDIVQAEDRGM